MKLYEALRKLCLEHGNIIVQKKNLVYLLSDMGAFEELPGMREAMKSLVSGWYAKDLYAAGLRKDSDFYLARAEDVKNPCRQRGASGRRSLITRLTRSPLPSVSQTP